MTGDRPRIEVAAAVIERSDESFLLAQRPARKVYAGYWEFPGGKVERGESALAALSRELHEELGIDVKRAYPWLTRDYDYEHAAVRLRFFRVTAWAGELHGREEQSFEWQHVGRMSVSPILPANGPILRALALPRVYGVSNAADVGAGVFLRRLEKALAKGLRLVQLREKAFSEGELVDFARRAVGLAHASGAKVLLNAEVRLAATTGADGVHLTAARLMETRTRPDCDLVGASCHTEREIAHAAALGLDFAVVGPVGDTATHPGAATLGWRRFAELVKDCPMPVYAIGGLGPSDLEEAWHAGAHGIAAIRAAWPDA